MTEISRWEPRIFHCQFPVKMNSACSPLQSLSFQSCLLSAHRTFPYCIKSGLVLHVSGKSSDCAFAVDFTVCEKGLGNVLFKRGA